MFKRNSLKFLIQLKLNFIKDKERILNSSSSYRILWRRGNKVENRGITSFLKLNDRKKVIWDMSFDMLITMFVLKNEYSKKLIEFSLQEQKTHSNKTINIGKGNLDLALICPKNGRNVSQCINVFLLMNNQKYKKMIKLNIEFDIFHKDDLTSTSTKELINSFSNIILNQTSKLKVPSLKKKKIKQYKDISSIIFKKQDNKEKNEIELSQKQQNYEYKTMLNEYEKTIRNQNKIINELKNKLIVTSKNSKIQRKSDNFQNQMLKESILELEDKLNEKEMKNEGLIIQMEKISIENEKLKTIMIEKNQKEEIIFRRIEKEVRNKESEKRNMLKDEIKRLLKEIKVLKIKLNNSEFNNFESKSKYNRVKEERTEKLFELKNYLQIIKKQQKDIKKLKNVESKLKEKKLIIKKMEKKIEKMETLNTNFQEMVSDYKDRNSTLESDKIIILKQMNEKNDNFSLFKEKMKRLYYDKLSELKTIQNKNKQAFQKERKNKNEKINEFENTINEEKQKNELLSKKIDYIKMERYVIDQCILFYIFRDITKEEIPRLFYKTNIKNLKVIFYCLKNNINSFGNQLLISLNFGFNVSKSDHVNLYFIKLSSSLLTLLYTKQFKKYMKENTDVFNIQNFDDIKNKNRNLDLILQNNREEPLNNFEKNKNFDVFLIEVLVFGYSSFFKEKFLEIFNSKNTIQSLFNEDSTKLITTKLMVKKLSSLFQSFLFFQIHPRIIYHFFVNLYLQFDVILFNFLIEKEFNNGIKDLENQKKIENLLNLKIKISILEQQLLKFLGINSFNNINFIFNYCKQFSNFSIMFINNNKILNDSELLKKVTPDLTKKELEFILLSHKKKKKKKNYNSKVKKNISFLFSKYYETDKIIDENKNKKMKLFIREDEGKNLFLFKKNDEFLNFKNFKNIKCLDKFIFYSKLLKNILNE